MPQVRPDQRAGLLGSGWKQSSDTAWTTIGDATGFHVLVADAKTGYTWRTAATLSVPGLETDQWVGNACLTASGRRAMVVYAPRSFTNTAELARRGGFTAVVDLRTGAVRKLPITTSLAYFNPGCGSGETAVLTQEGDEDLGRTRLVKVDTATGRAGKGVQVKGQITSAVPTSAGITAAEGYRLVDITGAGRVRRLAATASVPSSLRVDREGAVSYLDRNGGTTRLLRTRGKKTTVLAEAPAGQLGLRQGTGGRLYLTGRPSRVSRLPAGIKRLNAPARAEISTHGAIALTTVTSRQDPFRKVRTAESAPDPDGPQRVTINATVTGTGRTAAFTVDPDARLSPRHRQGQARVRVYDTAPASSTRLRAASGSPTNPTDTDGWCSISRNDIRAMAYQPTPRQVEWAVDMAVLGADVSRPAGFKGFGLAAYSTQGLFPRRNDVNVPPQIFLGILSQESNLWQASRTALSGEYGNPLAGNIYGLELDDKTGDIKDWVIHWDKADCGYGISQLTDGMRKPEHAKDGEATLPYNAQKAAALDYATSIAAGLQLVQDKWNQTYTAGMKLHNGDSTRIENWFYATWAYNSGFYPKADAANNNGAWGLGWFNNPINPRYPADRNPFLHGNSWGDAAHPQDWPYPEKVLGFASYSIDTPDGPGFRPAWWTTEDNRTKATAPYDTFCDGTNQCEPGARYVPNDPDVIGQPAGPCAHKNPANGLYDLHCYYNQPAQWKDDNCASSCGNPINRFEDDYPEQPDGTHYPPQCNKTAGLPSGALVVDDVPSGTPVHQCGSSSSAGSFGFTFTEDTDQPGTYPGKIDLHQLGGGYSGHFWFGHTRKPGDRNKLAFTGTWTLGQQISGWARVLVHLPDHGAHTQQAKYQINLGNGTRTRYVNQNRRGNAWVSIGVYQFSGTPQVKLTNQTEDGYGEEDIAYDAIAFQKLPGKPRHIVAALGDSYSSGEGAGNYLPETDTQHGDTRWNACRRSLNAWPRKMRLPGTNDPTGTLADDWNANVELGFVACSGAWNRNVTGVYYNEWYPGHPSHWDIRNEYERGEGQFREVAQINSGVLSSDTTLVTLTIGGNDRDTFTAAMLECGNITNCSGGLLTKYKPLVDESIGNTRETLSKIRAKAPNARIVLVGYPELLSRTVKCAGSLYYDLTETQALGDLVRYGTTEQRKLVAGLGDNKIVFLDKVVEKFTGHAGCDSDEWINKFVDGPNGDGDFHQGDRPTPLCITNGTFCFSRESFHPKSSGTTGYADLITASWPALGYS
ncbi:hypothetical protein AB0C21_05565 [Spirillospora sp. NPDC049024]